MNLRDLRFVHPIVRILLGFALLPVATSTFVVGITSLYSYVEWPGTFLVMLAMCSASAIVFGIPVFWYLKARQRQQLIHYFFAGLVIGIPPGVLLYAVTVEPISSLTTLAGAALGGMIFWVVAVAGPGKSREATR